MHVHKDILLFSVSLILTYLLEIAFVEKNKINKNKNNYYIINRLKNI